MKRVAMVLVGDIGMDGRVQKEIRTLLNGGFEITLIQWPWHGPSGACDSWGIRVINYPRRLGRSAIVNFLHYVLFNVFALRQLRRLAPTIVQCNNLDTLLAGFLFRHRARIIYDAHELFPESKRGLRRWIWTAVEKCLVHGCDAYIHAERNRLAYFANKHHIDSRRIVLVENLPPAAFAFSGRDRLREHFGLPPETVILLCTGVLLPGRAIESMIHAVELLEPRFVLVLLGPTAKGYEKDLASLVRVAGTEDRVKFHPAVPNADMLDYMACSDVGLVFYENTNLNNYWCASNKLYEFIMCGKPVVTNDYPGLYEVVERQRLGRCISETSPEAIALAVREVCDGIVPPTLRPTYVWEQQETTYLSVYE